jgi:outer membrane immunogenic protein
MRVALGASLALGLLSGSAMAADLGPYRPGSIKDIPPPDFIPAFSWTGIYLGAQAGYGWGDASFKHDGIGSSAAWDLDGWFGGGYAGFNWQLNSLVVGVEGDVNAADIDGSTTTVDAINFSSDIDAVASIRGRLGLAADRWLFFVTGGWAWADANHTQEQTVFPFDTVSADTTLDGWTVGGGVEYAFTDHVIGRVEYRHYDFDSKTLDMNPVNSSGRFDTDLDTVSAGIALKF